MIDQTLILDNVDHVRRSIENATPTLFSGLFKVENVFDDRLLSKLHDYIFSVDQNKWQTVEKQEKKNRSSITWDSDTIVEELHEILGNMTDVIREKFPNYHHNYLGTSVWKDWKGYDVDWHTDNPIISVSLQVYLFDYAHRQSGTIFRVKGTELNIPYVHNTGYLCWQIDPRIEHKNSRKTLDSETRFSVYSIWSHAEKNSE